MPINKWPKEDRPREKLLKNGERTLTNSELLSVILRTGTKGTSALDLARKILQEYKTFRGMGKTDLSQWKKIKGIGNAKITQIKAAIEIGRRLNEEKIKDTRIKIESSRDIADILMPRIQDLKKETFVVVLLNAQNRIIDIIENTEGTVNQVKPIIREVFHAAIQQFACFIICAHNHPSGDPTPSPEDKTFTQALIKTGNMLSVECLDHIIFGNGNYFSFSDEGVF